MEKRPFDNEHIIPGEDKLKPVLGKTFELYALLNELSAKFKKEWNFSKSSGWIQKVYDGKKALYYFIPLERSFLISLTLREKEKAEFLSDPAFIKIHDQLNNAKKYSEGYAMRFFVNSRSSFSTLASFIKKLTELRK